MVFCQVFVRFKLFFCVSVFVVVVGNGGCGLQSWETREVSNMEGLQGLIEIGTKLGYKGESLNQCVEKERERVRKEQDQGRERDERAAEREAKRVEAEAETKKTR